MGGEEEEEEESSSNSREVEKEVEEQLSEQRDSLSTIQLALSSDPHNPDLLLVYEELVVAIKDAEEGLFQLKRARLIREADLALEASKSNVVYVEKTENLDRVKEVEAEPLEKEGKTRIGSKCRFRHIDGRWYDGVLVALEEGPKLAKVSFLKPTSENMVMCKFSLQDRCRFGGSCRFSHGIDVSLSSLKKYIPTVWDQSLVGSTIWALFDSKIGVWKKAELESWDDEIKTGQVVFRENGSSAKLGIDSISLSKYAQMSDEEEEEDEIDSFSSSEESDTSGNEGESIQGLGFTEITAQQKGIQTETAIFAKWENHTRGIASKMMANMGYREGMGLGASGQGIINPISVKVLPPKQSLDYANHSHEKMANIEKLGKKRSRGGKRKRDKKFAEAARSAKEKEEGVESDVFTFINTQLAMKGKKAENGSMEVPKKEDRRALIAYEDEIKELRAQVGKLQEMANRNKKEKVVYEAAMRKLNETRKALSKAETAHTSASKAVNSKEKEKKWLKF